MALAHINSSMCECVTSYGAEKAPDAAECKTSQQQLGLHLLFRALTPLCGRISGEISVKKKAWRRQKKEAIEFDGKLYYEFI